LIKIIEYILEEAVTRNSSVAETQDQSRARSSASSLEDDVRDESGNQVTNTPTSSQNSLQSTSTPLTTTFSTLNQHPVDSITGTLHSEETSSTISQQLADNPSTYIIPQQLSLILSTHGKPTVSQATDHCVTYCQQQNISDTVEILRCTQKFLVRGKPLNGYTGAPDEQNDESNFILINRYDVIGTAMDEIAGIEDVQLTLEVSFYGENAQDAGGPRREFFRLCVKDIKRKYFDSGLKEHLSEDYETVGLILALSVLQNGNIPRFLTEDQLQEIFINETTASSCLANLAKGLNKLGLCDIGKAFPIFLHLFRASDAPLLTRRRLLHLLKPKFSEEGGNQRQVENQLYALVCKYAREAGGGKRGNVTLDHNLQFATGTDEEPVLGFGAAPSIIFVTSNSSNKWSFLPTANTCTNALYLPCGDIMSNITLPSEDDLFEIYDMAFCNAYFGNR
jgi:hypothetical protein